MNSNDRVYLDCPYEEKDLCKELEVDGILMHESGMSHRVMTQIALKDGFLKQKLKNNLF